MEHGCGHENKNMDWQRKQHDFLSCFLGEARLPTCQVYVNNYAAVRIRKKTKKQRFRPHWGGLNSSVAQRGKTEAEDAAPVGTV